MKKFIIICPNCKKKMKISDKSAKYRCPHCSKIYQYNFPKRVFYNLKDIFLGISQTFSDMKYNIKKKYSDVKATYQYMNQLKKHMKNDPNWSQYRKEQQEMKNVSPKKTFKNFFKRK